MVAILTVIGETLLIVSLLAWLVYDFLKLAGGEKGAQAFGNYVFNFVSSTIGVAVKFLTAAESQLEPIVNAFLTAVRKQSGPLSNAIDADIRGMVINAFNAVEKAVTLGKTSEPGDAIATGAAAMSEAFAFGMESFAVSAAFEACFPEKLNVLNGVGPMLSQLAGFAEVGGALREPLYRNAFGLSAEYYYRSIFKPELPDESDAVTWHSRGLLTDDQLKTIFDYSGLKTEYETAFITSAYRPVSAFIMLRLLESGVIDQPTLENALKFNGYRDQDIAALIKYAAWASTATYRAQYMSAVETAAELGLLTPDEVDAASETAQIPEGASDFIQLTVATKKLEQLAEIYRKSVSAAYKYGTIGDADYVPHLEAIGIAAADAEAHYALDSINKQGRALLAEERAAAAAARKLEAAAVKAAIAEYRAGNIDAAALTAALLAAGMDSVLAGYAVAVAAARQQGTQVLVYGVLMSRTAAELLREQVAAVSWQVKKALIDGPTAMAQLATLGVPLDHRQALVSSWLAYGQATVAPV